MVLILNPYKPDTLRSPAALGTLLRTISASVYVCINSYLLTNLYMPTKYECHTGGVSEGFIPCLMSDESNVHGM